MLENKIANIFDLVDVLKKPTKVLAAMGLSSDEVHKKIPHHCKACGTEGFSELTLLGVHTKPLFFECDYCGTLYLKRNKSWIINQFKKIEGLWTNPNDWYEPSHNEYN
jgi:hypothetical protein